MRQFGPACRSNWRVDSGKARTCEAKAGYAGGDEPRSKRARGEVASHRKPAHPPSNAFNELRTGAAEGCISVSGG